MNYSLIIRPLIGAVIGYVTNDIAVKMLFRPLKPIKIGRWILPFTPGVIPKNKERIANSIGETISNHLLTEEELSKVLLSKEKKEIVYQKMENFLKTISEDITVKEEVLTVLSEDCYRASIEKMTKALTESIVKTMVEQDVGRIIASQIEQVATQKTQGSMLGFLGINTVISGISHEVASKINDYILNNGNDLVGSIITQNVAELEETKIITFIEKVEKNKIDLPKIAVDIYEKVIREKLTSILKTVGISQIITEKIMQMDNIELEHLIMNIMKKELKALVNLGALIGFILGLLNLLF